MQIPFLSVPDQPLSASTQNHIPIADIAEDIILFKNGAATMILESSSLNFGLLSEKEQESVIAGYAGLLNSLTFHIQIVVKSQKKDVSSYISLLEEVEKKIKNPKLFSIMQGYKKFMVDSIQRKNVLSKSFYIVIPFTEHELGISKSIKGPFSIGQGEQTVPYTKAYVQRKAKIALYPKREHIVRQGRRLGLQITQLRDEDLIDLVYNTYNPEPPIKDKTIFE